jgi:peroxiredoxin
MMTRSDPRAPAPDILSAGVAAPEFQLPAGPDEEISLKQFRGRPVILAFYPADFSPVCGDQMALYNDCLDEFDEYKAQLLGISVDGPWCHKAYRQSRKLRFPLLADFHPQGAVSSAYGAFDKQWGTSRRALFVLDGKGVIRWSYLSPIDINPGADGILNALDALK